MLAPVQFYNTISAICLNIGASPLTSNEVTGEPSQSLTFSLTRSIGPERDISSANSELISNATNEIQIRNIQPIEGNDTILNKFSDKGIAFEVTL